MRVRQSRDSHVERIAELLGQAPLLASVADGELRRLAEEGTRRRFDEGRVIVQEGMPGSAFFVLLSGCASVSVGGRLLRSLRPGDSFGEVAAIGGRERTATVVAATDLECLALTPWLLRGFLSSHAPVAWRLARQVARLSA